MRNISALYYPFIAIQNETLLRRALIAWDELHVIDPFGLPHVNVDFANPAAVEAAEIIGRPRSPTEVEKGIAHQRIVQLVEEPLPEWFFLRSVHEKHVSTIYPEKFMPETWEYLQVRGLTRIGRERHEMEASAAMALAIMAVLAEVCAGSTLDPVTDQAESYQILGAYLARISDGHPGAEDEEHDRLVTIAVNTVDPDGIPLDRLVALRRKENDGAAYIRSSRHNLTKHLQRYVERLLNEANTLADQREIKRQYEYDLKDDLAILQEELKSNAIQSLSKGMAVGIVALAGTSIEPVSSLMVGAGAVLKQRDKYRTGRENILNGHVVSWLLRTKRFQPF